MECPRCKHDFDNSFMEETILCKDCDCKNKMAYHMCPNCKCMWRSLNGEVMDHSVADLGEMMQEAMGDVDVIPLPDDPSSFFEGVKEDLLKYARVIGGEAAMSDFVHKCLRCNSIAFPSSDSAFRCDSCGFEWEVKSLA